MGTMTTATKERPILFSGEMVRAIFDGRKTETRRVIKLQPTRSNDDSLSPDGLGWWLWRPGEYGISRYAEKALRYAMAEQCPYGRPGDRLWVRETWRIGAWNEDNGCVALDYKADGHCRREWLDVPDSDKFNDLWIQSTDDALAAGCKTDEDGQFSWEPGQSPCRWRSPIHMPSWASRIMLEIVDVRAERLQEITEQGAIAEGVECWDGEVWDGRDFWSGHELPPLRRFAALWDSINGKTYPWASNPWVWAIQFRVLETRARSCTSGGE